MTEKCLKENIYPKITRYSRYALVMDKMFRRDNDDKIKDKSKINKEKNMNEQNKQVSNSYEKFKKMQIK